MDFWRVTRPCTQSRSFIHSRYFASRERILRPEPLPYRAYATTKRGRESCRWMLFAEFYALNNNVEDRKTIKIVYQNSFPQHLFSTKTYIQNKIIRA